MLPRCILYRSGANLVCALCRVKALFGAKPHTKKDAVKAAGMGAPDNGKKAASDAPVFEYDTEAAGTGVRGLDMQ